VVCVSQHFCSIGGAVENIEINATTLGDLERPFALIQGQSGKSRMKFNTEHFALCVCVCN